MANNPHRLIWCFIKGDSNLFEIGVPINASVCQLKELIWDKGKNDAFRETDAKDLVLWNAVSSEWPTDSSQLTSYW